MTQPHQITPKTQYAVTFIKQKLRRRTLSPQGPVPPVRRLAAQCGVSKSTMALAVAHAKKAGLIAPDAQSDKRIGDLDPNAAMRRAELPWKRKRVLVENEIVSGIIGTYGRLPAIKEMQSRYHICFRTMRKILQAMEMDKVIRPSGKSYVLSGLAAPKLRNEVLFITSRNYLAQASALNHQHNHIANRFETVSLSMGLILKVVEIDFYDSGGSRRAIAAIVKNKSPIGFIVDLWWDDSVNVRQAYVDLLERLTTIGKPTAILDEFGNFELPVQFSLNPLVQTFTIERQNAGERVARYCLSLGHNQLAYFSLNHYNAWSLARYAGLQAQLSRAGHKEPVDLFAGKEHSSMLLNHLALSGLPNADIERIILQGRTAAQTADLIRQWRLFKATVFRGPQSVTPEMRSLRKNLSGLGAILRYGFEDDFLARIFDAALGAAGSRSFESNIETFFAQALASSAATAWVCATDIIGFGALRFLRAHGVDVPGDISVLGFDNTPVEALEHRLTSFDFNAAAFVHQMLHFIIRPPRPRGEHHHEPVEVEGTIIERDTTGRAGAVSRALRSAHCKS
jgi:DNA-binding LacI/PurR family transcriptional regulator/DNA-binding transcriptional regulator YhcF (GntR family)